MDKAIFIGDIAGQFDALMRLVEKCPKDRPIQLLGDLNDRGPNSKEVIEWASTSPNVDAVYANHEDMFIDWYEETEIYDRNLWVESNGGWKTLRSYHANMLTIYDDVRPWVSRNHILWLKKRPLFKETDTWIATHAPINPSIPFAMALDIHRDGDIYDDSVIWNRGSPRRRDKFQINGHNSTREVNWYKDKEGVFGACIDTSRSDVLTALVFPELEIIQVPYVPKAS